MIKAFAQAIPMYSMNLFKFPETLCNDLDFMIAGFWWGQRNGEQNIHWVSKNVLGLPKNERDLGLRNFKSFNDALLAKQCWHLIMEPNSLWAYVLKARYFPNCTLLEVQRGSRASWVWTSLLVGKDIILKGTHWQIMNGKNVRIWVNRWLPTLPSSRHTLGGTIQVTKDTRVATFINSDVGTWDLNSLHPFLSMDDLNANLDT